MHREISTPASLLSCLANPEKPGRGLCGGRAMTIPQKGVVAYSFLAQVNTKEGFHRIAEPPISHDALEPGLPRGHGTRQRGAAGTGTAPARVFAGPAGASALGSQVGLARRRRPFAGLHRR